MTIVSPSGFMPSNQYRNSRRSQSVDPILSDFGIDREGSESRGAAYTLDIANPAAHRRAGASGRAIVYVRPRDTNALGAARRTTKSEAQMLKLILGMSEDLSGGIGRD